MANTRSKKKAPPRKSSKTTAKKTSSRKSGKKTSTRGKEKTSTRGKKKTSSRKKTAKTTSTRKSGKKSSTRKSSKKTAKKTSSRKKTSTKKKGTCAKRRCSTCPGKSKGGSSLIDRARQCSSLEECRKFIIELGDAIEQSNVWLNEMHDQALSAEQTRDLYGEQISDLLEAIDHDRKRIAQLESELTKTRRKGAASATSDDALRKLDALGKEIRSIRSELKRLLSGRQPTAERRRKNRAAAKAPAKPKRSVPQRSAEEAVGPFAKYSVLRGAACSLGVGKHGYPPEVCAPAYFPRPVAAEILGTYAQNDYGGLAKWALITGLPIDDGAGPPRVVETTVTQGKTKSSRKTGTGRKKASSSRKKAGSGRKKAGSSRKKSSARVPKSSPPAVASEASRRTGSKPSQVLNQLLLTIERI